MKCSYVHGLDLISQNRSGNISYYHYDGQHSTRQLTDLSAEVTDDYTYDAFGLLLQRSGSTENNFLYTGEQFDPNVGFYYLRARYYNPEIGRFITVDPWKGSIYDPVSLHKYLYCNNDPVDFVDWSGEMTNFDMPSMSLSISVQTIIQSAKQLLWKVLDIFVQGAITAVFTELGRQIKEGKIDFKDLGKAVYRGGLLSIIARMVIKFDVLRVVLLELYYLFIDITKDYQY